MYEIHLISFINKILQFFRMPQVRSKSPNLNLLHFCVEKEIEFSSEIPVEYYHLMEELLKEGVFYEDPTII